jgi:hypothetical protein
MLFPLLHMAQHITSNLHSFVVPEQTQTIVHVMEWISSYQLEELLSLCHYLYKHAKKNEFTTKMNEQALCLRALIDHANKLYEGYQSSWFFAHTRVGNVRPLFQDIQTATRKLHVSLSFLQHVQISALCDTLSVGCKDK